MIDQMDAVLTLLRSIAPLTTLTAPCVPGDPRLGIFRGGDLPWNVAAIEAQDAPTCVAVDLLPAAATDILITPAPVKLRFYANSLALSYDLFLACRGGMYNAQGFSLCMVLVGGKYRLRGLDLEFPRQDMETDGWPVTAATLTTRWNALEVV